MIAAVTVRPLRAADIPARVGVLARAYVSQQNFEVRLHAYLQMTAVATFVAEREGEAVGMVVGNDYGPIAYVSQMAVDPPFHRRGIGTALMNGLIAWADDRGFAAVELDATASGAPLYARYGFFEAGQTLVYHGTPRAGGRLAARAYLAGDRSSLFAADARAFGADRSDVLRLLVDSADNTVFVGGPSGNADAYAIAQHRSQFLGPVIAPDAATAARLIDAARLHLPALHRISIPAENPAARKILADRGYRFARSLPHLVRGSRPPASRHEIFARINLGQG